MHPSVTKIPTDTYNMRAERTVEYLFSSVMVRFMSAPPPGTCLPIGE